MSTNNNWTEFYAILVILKHGGEALTQYSAATYTSVPKL
jgi:hypothetical protein